MKLVSGIVDSGFFAQSALSAEVATKDSLGRNISETYLTGVDLTPYQTTAGMTAYANSADVTGTAQYGLTTAGWSEITGGGVTGDYELSAGSGISIVDYPLEQKTVISVTAQGGNPEVEQTVIDNSATWNTVSDKLDATAFSDVSGTFLTAHQDLSDYQTTAGMTAYQPVGSYLTADALDNVSGNWNEVSAKLDTTAFSDVSGSFLTSVPDTYLQNTDLTVVDNKITEISGIALSAGDELPSGTMNTSALGYNAVNEISGYNGSAIAQYGAEKQWLTHDDTIVHVSNSAQYAFGVALPNISADLAKMLGVDETVIYESAAGATVNSANIITLNESLQNFEMIKIIDNSLNAGGCRRLTIIPVSTATRSIATNDAWFDTSYQPTANASKYIGANFYSANDAGTQIRMNGSYISHMSNTGAWTNRNDGHLYKIIGIGRKENA